MKTWFQEKKSRTLHKVQTTANISHRDKISESNHCLHFKKVFRGIKSDKN